MGQIFELLSWIYSRFCIWFPFKHAKGYIFSVCTGIKPTSALTLLSPYLSLKPLQASSSAYCIGIIISHCFHILDLTLLSFEVAMYLKFLGSFSVLGIFMC